MSRYQSDHYDVCDTIKLECGEQFCPDDAEQPAYGPNPEDFDPRFPSYLHDRGLCAECDSCWVDVDANLAYYAAQSDQIADHHYAAQSDQIADHHYAGMS